MHTIKLNPQVVGALQRGELHHDNVGENTCKTQNTKQTGLGFGR